MSPADPAPTSGYTSGPTRGHTRSIPGGPLRRTDELLDHALVQLQPALQHDAAHRQAGPRPFAVAYSGGADSTALLLACARRWPAAVRAIHVHHGLQAAADGFQAHCEAFCARLGVPLVVVRVDARHLPGQSPEDAARRARYGAIAQAVHAGGALRGVADVLVAQHADDQLETVLLALTRGAGLPGLAAMPGRWQRDGLQWHRPWLGLPAQALRDWLRAQGASWVEDPSNAHTAFVRNRLRMQVLPALLAAFPQARDTFARSARHAAQAQTLLDELAAQDLLALGTPPRIAPLRELSRPRQANVLRHWLRSAHGQQASAAQMDELLDQIAACATRGHRLRLKVGTGHVQRQGAHLDWYNP